MTNERRRIDVILLIIVVALVIFGIVMIFSASFYSTVSADAGPYYYLRLAVQWAAAGLVVMIIAIFVPYRVYYRLAPIIMIVSVLLLLALFTPLGYEVNGATRWIRIGAITIMPGEIAKIAVIVGLAWYYTKYEARTRTFIYGFALVIAAAFITFYMIYKQPNLATAMIILLLFFAMMFVAGVRFAYIAAAIVAGFFGILYMIRSGSAGGEHLRRITGFLDPFADAQGDFYQTVQGLLALGSGGLTGVGLGNSVGKALWLPYAQNDFIFAIIGEETGFIGCILVIIAYVLLIWRCMLISMRQKDRFAMLLGAGVACLFAIQVFLNIGVVTSILPPTGVILPFVSYGGNAIILFMFLIGVMLNISRGGASPEQPRRRHRRPETYE